MVMNVKYTILVVLVISSTALVPSTVVAQDGQQTEEQQTEGQQQTDESTPESGSLIPYEVQQILNQDPTEVSQEDINTVQSWYSDNSDSLPDPVATSIESWLENAENSDTQSTDTQSSDTEPQYEGQRWDSTAQTTYGFPERWDGNVRVYYVEYDLEDEVARVWVETDEPTTVVVADGTQTRTGAQLKTIQEVDGRAILSVQMRNPSNKHISVTANQGTWLAFGEPNFNFTPNVRYRIIVLFLGMIVVMGTVLANEQLANRHDQKPEREV